MDSLDSFEYNFFQYSPIYFNQYTQDNKTIQEENQFDFSSPMQRIPNNTLLQSREDSYNQCCQNMQVHCLSCAEQQKTQQQSEEPQEKPQKELSIRKNFPKLLGTHLLGHITQFTDDQIPDGIRQFKVQAEERKQNKKQLSFAIEDFRNICLFSEESKAYFIDFLLNKFIVILMHSSKFTNIELVLDLIRNSYVGACNPEKWKGNKQISITI